MGCKGILPGLSTLIFFFFNDEIITRDNLTIPHPGIPERMFTLLPLSELDRAFIHPGSRKSIDELISECQDTIEVYPYHP
jgi:7,8-dihydro-6-hydroxymethylpterin-pyrophosphokinase